MDVVGGDRLASGLCAARVLAATAEPPVQGQYACEKLFTFGLWGCEPRPTTSAGGAAAGHAAAVHERSGRRPKAASGAEGLEALRQDAALCRRYGVFVLPIRQRCRTTSFSRRRAERRAGDFWDGTSRMSRTRNFCPSSRPAKRRCGKCSPPAGALSVLPSDAAADFAPHQPLLLTDCYPLTYSDGARPSARTSPSAAGR